MMRILRLAIPALLALAPVACVTPPPSYTIAAPGLNITIGGDTDVWAINMAQWAFAASSRLAGRPVEAARAAAALEYLTLALNAPRWAAVSPVAKMELTTASADLRAVLGIPPDAPTMRVVQSLLDCANALANGDSVAAATTLRAPYFSFGAERTLEILNAMPFIRSANIATMHIGMSGTGGGGSVWRW